LLSSAATRLSSTTPGGSTSVAGGSAAVSATSSAPGGSTSVDGGYDAVSATSSAPGGSTSVLVENDLREKLARDIKYAEEVEEEWTESDSDTGPRRQAKAAEKQAKAAEEQATAAKEQKTAARIEAVQKAREEDAERRAAHRQAAEEQAKAAEEQAKAGGGSLSGEGGGETDAAATQTQPSEDWRRRVKMRMDGKESAVRRCPPPPPPAPARLAGEATGKAAGNGKTPFLQASAFQPMYELRTPPPPCYKARPPSYKPAPPPPTGAPPTVGPNVVGLPAPPRFPPPTKVGPNVVGLRMGVIPSPNAVGLTAGAPPQVGPNVVGLHAQPPSPPPPKVGPPEPPSFPPPPGLMTGGTRIAPLAVKVSATTAAVMLGTTGKAPPAMINAAAPTTPEGLSLVSFDYMQTFFNYKVPILLRDSFCIGGRPLLYRTRLATLLSDSLPSLRR